MYLALRPGRLEGYSAVDDDDWPSRDHELIYTRMTCMGPQLLKIGR